MGRIHAANAVRIPEIALVAYCDSQEASAETLLHEFGGCYSTSDSGRVFRDDSIDAVLICTWHDTHLGLALQAAEAGKHILVEKPMAMNTADCLRIEEAVEKAGVKLMVDFKFRFAPTVTRARACVRQPHLVFGQSISDRPPAPNSWVFDSQKGGGFLLSGGCHNFDLICYLAQSEPVRVSAEGGTFIFPETHFPDNVAATILFENGSVGSFVQGLGRKSGYTSTWFFESFGADATATLFDHCREVEIAGADVQRFSIREACPDGNTVGTWQLLNAFARCILDDAPPSPDARDGTRSTLLVERTVESLRSGQPRQIDMRSL